jgi:hypothetical protein
MKALRFSSLGIRLTRLPPELVGGAGRGGFTYSERSRFTQLLHRCYATRLVAVPLNYTFKDE